MATNRLRGLMGKMKQNGNFYREKVFTLHQTLAVKGVHNSILLSFLLKEDRVGKLWVGGQCLIGQGIRTMACEDGSGYAYLHKGRERDSTNFGGDRRTKISERSERRDIFPFFSRWLDIAVESDPNGRH